MDQPGEGNLLEIIDLAHSLRQEHLYISNEQQMFRTLNETLTQNSSNVAQLAWICAQQRQNLNRLIVSHADTGPALCCHKANLLENTKFIEVHKAKDIQYMHVISYVDLFNFLHRSPYLLAQSLAVGDRVGQLSPDHMNSVVHTIASGLYGNAILSKDVDMVLRLLRELIEIQIVVSDNPRRMLLSGACAFSRLYHRLHESLFSSKLFLTAALHESAMRVLIEDDLMLDIDPMKAIASFAPADKLKRFGVEGTIEFEEKIIAYRRESLQKLYQLSAHCINMLLDKWALFPSTLRWVVQTMCHLLKSAHIPTKEINHILTDMVFTNFICPAVVSPDLFGITDAPVSENARYNLIQIGQVIQMMALTKHETIDVKFEELFNMFDRNIVAELMEQLQETEYDVSVSMMAIPHQNDFGRNHVLVTKSELDLFVEFFRSVLAHDEISISGEDRRKLGRILDQLPDKATIVNSNGLDLSPPQPQDLASNNSSSNSRTKQSLINLGKSTKSKLAKSINIAGGVVSNNHHHNQNDPAVDNPDDSDLSNFTNHNNNINNNNNNSIAAMFEQVLIVPITISDESKFQLLTEQEVLNMNNISGTDNEAAMKKIIDIARQEDDDDDDDDDDDEELRKVSNPVFGDVAAGLRTRKQTRFSLSNDDQSIGNTSDNLEVVSEIPSNHSVTSSVEMEDNYQALNDNLSDMVSANVSGRGSPNISGRDTPSSQVTEGEAPAIPSIQMVKILNKARSDINDKFCKFEINKLVEVDETVSIISDTWSTDVLASDSETLEPIDCDRNFSTPLIPSAVTLPGDSNFTTINGRIMQLPSNLLDSSETRSESAWSTDVLASDSEKLIELDTDDNNSVHTDTTDNSRNELDILMRVSESSFHTPRSQNTNFPTPPSNDSVFSNNRSFNSSGSGPFGSTARFRHSTDEFTRYLSPISPLVQPIRQSSSNHYNISGGSSLHQQQRSVDRDAFAYIPKPIMRRQNSAESSISNQSSSNGDTAASSASRKPKHNDYRHSAYVVKTNTNISNPFAEKENLSAQNRPAAMLNHHHNQPLIPFNGEPTTSNNNNHNNTNQNDDDASVEHRDITMAQRSTSFDGRRNGIHSPKVMSSNYENHEIIFKTRTTTTTPSGVMSTLESSITDDDKSRRQKAAEEDLLLVDKTNAMCLVDTSIPNGNNDEVVPVVLDIQDDMPSTSNNNNNNNNEVSAAAAAVKPSSARYTGTIPKSISFDESANKRGSYRNMRNSDHHQQQSSAATTNHHHHHNHHHSAATSRHTTHGHGFFNKLKQGFRNRRSHKARDGSGSGSAAAGGGGGFGGGDDYFVNLDGVRQHANARNNCDQSAAGSGGGDDDLLTGNDLVFSDPNEDILAKYRRKISSSSEATNSDSLSHRKNSQTEIDPSGDAGVLLDEVPMMLSNAKRKLRLVLSTTDLHTADFRHTSCHKIPPLMTYLQIQLAQALNLQNLQQISFVSETIRCLRQLDESQQRQLILELRQDLIQRQSYLQYLMRYRQHLLSALENIDRFEDRLRNDRDMCNRHLIMVCVRMFLEKRMPVIQTFQAEFGALTVVDEKIDCMDEFMGKLMNELMNFGVLQGMAQWQQQEARVWIERILLQKLYRQVMFPNDEGDLSRDEVLRIHIEKLSRIISPSHHLLRIPQDYLIEAPWPFAQQQIAYISAYKTPREKVQCVVRCIRSIMNLLQMASNRVPAADDLVPVLIFVVIKANPPYLLSTIQYVNAFIGNELEGEDQYWWTQFSAAVTFIKTMDYTH